MPILTVSQLNRYVAFKLQEDSNLRTVFVRGEIANFTRNFRSGHCYFSVRDEEASVRAVMFRANADRLPFAPENGMHILLQGTVTLYERDGAYQINVTDLQPDGVGAQALALQQRREKLAKLGFFASERKRPLPKLPQKIGIVTSQSGAALQDMLHILRRRYPIGTVQVYPALVQGEQAPASIAAALAKAGSDGCDVILMGRGGGSNEDLSAFQSEAVAQAVFAAPVPVVSAVGHETDHCIADEVADLRAPTPSAAAELAVPEISALKEAVSEQSARLERAFSAFISGHAEQLARLTAKLEQHSPARTIQLKAQEFDALTRRLHTAMDSLLKQTEQRFLAAAGRLESVSPVAVLQRGYALVYQEDGLARDAAALHPGDTLRIRLANGSLTAKVTAVREESDL